MLQPTTSNLKRKSTHSWYASVSIALTTFFVYQLANVTAWHCSIPEEKKIANRNIRQAEAEVEPPSIGSLPDRLINPGEYQQPFYTPLGNHKHPCASRADVYIGFRGYLNPVDPSDSSYNLYIYIWFHSLVLGLKESILLGHLPKLCCVHVCSICIY